MDFYNDWRARHQPQPVYNSPRLNSIVEDYPLALVDMQLLDIFDVYSPNCANVFGL